ncbi:GGDEF domain-containing protein [Halomonas sp. NyZ770]|uniref:GGDEF domain-containing protein n=1 Tax=Halomonas sp. NyZ770 TaxID=2883106 RepID=UPI001D0A69F1|nr:GGDEF domain-containing protein [Halomonas sp. NyZ770]UDM08458.1 GGDEF domain-containing protein [Halomonas sp. NyZ770]
MAFDPPTLLTLTIAIAAAAALYLLMEWRGAREQALLLWAAGFATVTVGSSLSLLRANGFFLVGVWFANGLLILAHWLFLLGVLRFVGQRPSRAWWLLVVIWCGLLLPEPLTSSKLYLSLNSLLVGLLALRASWALKLESDAATLGTRQLHYVLMIHGLFYVAKGLLPLAPNTLVNLMAFQGAIIRISLVEGSMAILLIALSMTGTVRYQRERHITHLAERDALTSLLNRRGFEAQAPRVLKRISPSQPGALLLLDLDNFKQINDLYGHAAGDHLLLALADIARQTLPTDALLARLGGDEFVFLLKDVNDDELLHIGQQLRQRFHTVASHTYLTPAPVSLSLGVTRLTQPTQDLSSLLAQSDQALYEAKRRGRNRMEIC